MGSKRYKKILEILHVNDNNDAISKDSEAYNKLHKITLKLNESSYLRIISVGLSVDESVKPFKGAKIHHIPMKCNVR